VADGLKTGIVMKPQLFVEASVSFVVIYNFAVIVSKMTPVQTVDLINHLWIIFDEVAAKHNVYKVGHCNCAISASMLLMDVFNAMIGGILALVLPVKNCKQCYLNLDSGCFKSVPSYHPGWLHILGRLSAVIPFTRRRSYFCRNSYNKNVSSYPF